MQRIYLLAAVFCLLGLGAYLLFPGGPRTEPAPPADKGQPASVPQPPSDVRPLLALWEHLRGPAPSSPVRPDLARIDRRIGREPRYRTKPRYCLLVFGRQAGTRVWLVQDGETLYVDGNANGDLTEPGEAFAPTERSEAETVEDDKTVPYRERQYSLGQVQLPGESALRTELALTCYQFGEKPPAYVLSVRVNGTTLQYAGWEPLFAASREQAAVLHFGGPVVPQRLRNSELSLSAERQELHLRFGTPGQGEHSFVSVCHQAVPEHLPPVAEIDWPVPPGSAPVKTTAALTQRC